MWCGFGDSRFQSLRPEKKNNNNNNNNNNNKDSTKIGKTIKDSDKIGIF